MENKKQEQPKEGDIKVEKEMRQIIIETDGNNIKLTKTEVAGSLELIAILSTLLDNLKK